MKCKAIGLLLSGILCTGSHVSACIGPSNVEGVAFTNGEKLEFGSLKALGTDGVNYRLATSESGGTTVTYPSHYDSKAMVFIGNVGLSYQKNMSINCMGIIFPVSEEMLNSYEHVTKDVFDFADAVKDELEWLVTHNILTIEEAAIDSIFKDLEKSGNGGVQYWTLQKNALGYNSWYSYDTVNGVWSNDGADGVNGVKSVRGVYGCSGVEIPELETFAPVSVKDMVQFKETRAKTSLIFSGRTITVQGLQTEKPVDIKILSITGKILKSFTINGNSEQTVELKNIIPGTYIVSGKAVGLTFNQSVVVF